MRRNTIILLLLVLAILALIAWKFVAEARVEPSSDRILLLVPDGISKLDSRVTVWLDAANEEGLHVIPVHDSEFLRPVFGTYGGAGVILPDSIHQRVGDILLFKLRHFVANGGKLLLVYDAGTLSPNGRYLPHESRLSELAGISYALYDTLGDHTIQWSAVRGPSTLFERLEIPPGKYYPFQLSSPVDNTSDASQEFEAVLRRYQYGNLEYPSFVTSGAYSGRVLLHSDASVVAGEKSFQEGSVLFVNLPLGYLAQTTDGLMLHAFLGYFAVHTLGLPRMLAVPDGVGGLVLNWHVDSNAAIGPMQQMESWGMLQQGPFSVHITAGPDSGSFGDRRGFDLPHNAVGQDLIRKYVALGYAIGSHGGWIHDYFSAHVETDSPKELEKYLEMNKNALEQVTGKPVVEYSAPNGDQPSWVTSWLDAHGFIGYYFTGDSGMGPTQVYRSGVREGKNIWAFPILHLDRAAAFEEMSRNGYTTEQVEAWLKAITEFTSDHHLVRLIYFHPPGAIEYQDTIQHWMEMTGAARANNQFRWYTMTQVATFLNDRKRVQWKTGESDGVLTIDASHPQSLIHLAWQINAQRYSEPQITHGNGLVRKDRDSWIISAQEGKELQFQARELQP